jgi:hypothetical protein
MKSLDIVNDVYVLLIKIENGFLKLIFFSNWSLLPPLL